MVEQSGWPSLGANEQLIDSTSFPDENALRNVNPSHHQAGVLTSQVYEPSDDDQGLLSTARDSVVTAPQHFDEFTQLGRASDGVSSLAVGAIYDAGLRWIDDSQNVTEVSGHASIDFRTPDPAKQSKRQRKKIARILAKKAAWTYCNDA